MSIQGPIYYSKEYNDYYYVDSLGESRWVQGHLEIEQLPHVYKEKLVTVNSCLANYGTSSHFKIKLDDVKSDKIVDIQLRTAIIPKTWLTIDASNNLFYKDGTLMRMPLRNYANGHELASVLSNILMVPVHFQPSNQNSSFKQVVFPSRYAFLS